MRSFLLLVFVSIASFCPGQTPKSYLIRAGKLYDSEKNVFLKNQEILVQGKKIIKVGTNLARPSGTEVIDLQQATVTPGLIDAHTHILTIQKSNEPLEVDILMNSDLERSLRAVKIARSYLDAGFTTIRDLGNSGPFLDLNMKRAINKEWMAGPRMVISGPIMSPEDGQFFNLSPQNHGVIEHEYRVIKNPEDARQAVKDHISRGVDVIKIVMGDGRITLTLAEVRAIVETAHSFGMKVTAHATYNEVIDRALEGGVDGIEHGYGIADSLLDKMAAKKVYLVPTIGTFNGYRELFDAEHKQTDEQLKGLTEFVNSSYAIIRKALEKGVMIVNGADMYIQTPLPQGTAAKNSVEAYYEACKNAGEVLRMATWNAAIACGVQRATGVIREGMDADIVAFAGDMEKDLVSSLYKVRFVMKQGQIFTNEK